MPEPAATPYLRPAFLTAALAMVLGIAVSGALAMLAQGGVGSSVTGLLRTAVQGWLVAQGSGLDLEGTSVGLVPLGATAIVILVVARSARWVVADPVEELGPYAATVAGTCGAVAAVLSAVTNAGDLHTSVIRAAFGAFAVGGIGSAVGAARRHGRTEMLWFTERADVRAVVRGAWWGAATLLGAAATLVVVLLTLHIDRAADLWALLDPGSAGGFALAAACVLSMPTLVLWATSVLLGPGFMLGTDTSVDLTGSHLGAVPGFPPLAALPAPGEFPGWVFLLGLVPLLAGSGGRLPDRSARSGRGVGPRPARPGGARRAARRGRPDSPWAWPLPCPVAESGPDAWPTPARPCSRRCSSRCPSWPWGVPWVRFWRTIVAPVPPSSRTSHRTARLVVLVSGGGTNLQALIDATTASKDSPTAPDHDAEIVAVGADRDDIEGLARAERAGIPTFVVRTSDHDDRADWDVALADAVAAHDPDLVVLAGFMKLAGPAFLGLFGGRTINTHPSLLPSFPGMNAPRDALDHGVKITGATLFVVDEGVDTGPIIAQVAVPVLDDDDVETLHERIKTEERAMLVDWVGRLAHEIVDHRTTTSGEAS